VEYYRSLLKNNPDEYQSTRQANFIAALATWKLTDPSSKIQLVLSIYLILEIITFFVIGLE
jgi:hypothetical protein